MGVEEVTEGPPHPLRQLAIAATSIVALSASDALDTLVDALIEWRVIVDETRTGRFRAPKAYRRWVLLREWAWTWAWDEVNPRFHDREKPGAALDTWLATASAANFFGIDRAVDSPRLAGVRVESQQAAFDQIMELFNHDIISRQQARHLLGLTLDDLTGKRRWWARHEMAVAKDD